MVHQYQLNGYNIVLDTCSGSVHVVDDVAYDIIAMYPEHTADEIVSAMMAKYGDREDVTEENLRQCIDDVTNLKEAGKLWTPDTYENMAFDFKNRNTVVKALCLHVAHTCNLNCSYCFASQGRYQGDRALMSFEVGKRAMDFLIENSGTRRNLEVDFFGGEPLMNFDMVKKLVAYCREQEKIHNKNFRFTMTTNGMLIDDDVIDFCNKECHNVVLSLDGRKEVNDRFRKDYAGHGSYDTIVPKFQEFVKKRGDKNYYMRGTYTHYNTDFTNDIFHICLLYTSKTLMTIRAAETAFVKWCRRNKYTTLYPDLSIPKNARMGKRTILQPTALKVLFSVDTRTYYGKLVFDEYIYAYRFAVATGLRPGELIVLWYGDIKGNTVNLRPVSYTHLDVYKRQNHFYLQRRLKLSTPKSPK